ncbi:hypothetical protein [Methanosphaera sp.]
MNTKKISLFLVVLTVLILGITSVNAIDVSGNNTLDDSSYQTQETVDNSMLNSIEENTVKTICENNTKTIQKNTKSQLKTDGELSATTIKINGISSFEYAVNKSITGSLNDSNGNMGNAEVTLNLDNGTYNYTVFTNTNGIFNFTFNSTVIGLHNFTIIFNGDDTHKAINKSSIFYVNKQLTYLSIYPEMMSVVDVGDDLNITGRLTNRLGESIPQTTLILYVGTTRKEVTTDDNGYYSYIYPVTSAKKGLTFNITYNGSDIYKNQINSSWIDAEKRGLVINIDQLPNPVINSTFQVTGSILEEYTNKPLSNYNITVTTGGVNYNAVTDENGRYNVSVIANSKEGSQRVTVTAANSLRYDKASDYDTTDVILLKINTTVNTTISDNILVVSGIVIDERGIPVNNETMVITVNSKEYDVVTDENGFYLVNHTLTSAGNQVISIYHQYNNVFGTIDLELSKFISATIKLTIDESNAIKIGDTLKINGTLKDAYGNLISDGDVVLNINGVNITTLTTDSMGSYFYNYLSTQARNNITVIYSGNNVFNTAINSKIITLQKGSSKTTVTLTELTKDAVLLHIIFTDEDNGNLLSIGEFDITDNSGNIIKTETNNEGIIDLLLTLNSRGTHTFTINYHENEDYNPSTDTVTFTIAKENTTLTVNEIENIAIGQIVNINGILTDDEGKEVVNEDVLINVNGNNIARVTTSSTGEYNYKYTTTTVGLNTIVVTYAGNDNYTSATNSTLFNVTKGTSNITGTVKEISDDYVIINIQITAKETGSAITEGFVKVNSGEEVLAIVNVNDTSTDLQLNITTVGTYKLTLVYNESDNYNSSSTTVIFTIEKSGTNIVLNPVNPIINKMITISGVLFDNYGRGLANREVIININDVIVKVTTGDDGEYTYQYNLTTPSLQNVLVSYAGDDKYNASNISTTFEATKGDVTINISPITGIVRDVVSIQAVLVDSNDNLVNGQVIFKVNGKMLRDLNGDIISVYVVNGIVEIEKIILQDNWFNYNNGLTIIYPENDQYKSKQVNTALIVTKRSASISIDSLSAKIGETIILQAHITDDNQDVTDGKVVFKINGKTIRDDNGNVIYVNVLNGIAQLTYELPENIVNKTYTITCIYTNALYNRSEKTTTLTVTV